MRSTTSTDIVCLDGYDTNGAGEFLFAAIGHTGEFSSIGVGDSDRDILNDSLIGQTLDLLQLRISQDSIEVDGHRVGSHVKANIVQTVKTVNQPRHNMFTRVLLHIGEANIPVQLAMDSLPRGEWLANHVQDFSVKLLDIEDRDVIQGASVRRLSAPLREERCLIQNNPIALCCFLAADDGCGERLQMTIKIIELSRVFHIQPPRNMLSSKMISNCILRCIKSQYKILIIPEHG